VPYWGWSVVPCLGLVVRFSGVLLENLFICFVVGELEVQWVGVVVMKTEVEGVFMGLVVSML